MTYRIHPEIEGWLADEEWEALHELAQQREVLEIGAYRGRSTVALASAAEHVTTIDHFRGDGYTNKIDRKETLWAFLEALDKEGVADRVTTIVGTLEDALPRLTPDRYKLVFYDASHDGPTTRFALQWIFDNFDLDTTDVAVHDYNRVYPNYVDAADQIDWFAAETGRRLHVVNTLAVLPSPQATRWKDEANL